MATSTMLHMFHLLEVAIVALLVPARAEPVKLIIDTDIGGGGCHDVDDVAALVVGHTLMDNGEAELLAVVVNTSPKQCPGVVSVLNHYYGRDDVPIGSYKHFTTGGTARYVYDLVDNWDSPIKSASEVPSGVEVYRKVLAAQPDHSVVISSIGLMTNLRDLLESKADEYSPLSGSELVAQKVKLLAAMAGKFPHGWACNVMGAPAPLWGGSSASHYVYSHWPSAAPILYLGGEVGLAVLTGAPLVDCVPESSPVRKAYIDHVGAGNTRPSWDPLTILIAVRGASAGGCSFCADCDGTNHVNRLGHNEWVKGPPSNQTYLVLDNAQAAASAVDALLCQLPAQGPASKLAFV